MAQRELICVDKQYYIRATSTRIDDRTLVLKQGETFAVFDRFGDIHSIGRDEHGIYHQDTRFLSSLELKIEGQRLLLLNSTVKSDNSLLTVDLTNPELTIDPERWGPGFIKTTVLPQGALHIFRSKLLWKGACYERIRLTNYWPCPVGIDMSIDFDADFADIFEVRGTVHKKKGHRLPAQVEKDRLLLSYIGLDRMLRRLSIVSSRMPDSISNSRFLYNIALRPRQDWNLYILICCYTDMGKKKGSVPVDHARYKCAVDSAARELKHSRDSQCRIFTSNEQFNDWINRSVSDLHMLTTETAYGPFPYAGVPWFSAPFGRDGIITALECLSVNPELARGVLAFLAATQARDTDPEKDAQPGKILHEMRQGEMAACGEVPFGVYYGSVDATPLYVTLAWEYFMRTGDIEFIKSIWPNILAALSWIEDYGDMDGDGLVEYSKSHSKGLANQGWKDSDDSVFHRDGSSPVGPVALCEVQGYCVRAYLGAARLACILGEKELEGRFYNRAKEIRETIEKAFWIEELSTYAIALDGEKRPCEICSSNAGHLLFAGVVRPDRAERLSDTLMSPSMFSGWGIRTISDREARYNPMSYHNGSVWPHDNALIALGLSRYGLKHQTLRIMTGLFDASIFMDMHRLPELFCGFIKRPCEGPTLYPVACLPQAWASATVFCLLQAALGLSFDIKRPQLRFCHPVLPPFLSEVQIRDLNVPGGRVDLDLQRHANNVSINVKDKEGDVEIAVIH